MCIVVLCQAVLTGLLDWMLPRNDIDVAPPFDYDAWASAHPKPVSDGPGGG